MDVRWCSAVEMGRIRVRQSRSSTNTLHVVLSLLIIELASLKCEPVSVSLSFISLRCDCLNSGSIVYGC